MVTIHHQLSDFPPSEPMYSKYQVAVLWQVYPFKESTLQQKARNIALTTRRKVRRKKRHLFINGMPGFAIVLDLRALPLRVFLIRVVNLRHY